MEQGDLCFAPGNEPRKHYHVTLFDLAVDPPALRDEQRARVGI